MSIALSTVLGLFFIVLQTACLPLLFNSGRSFDLLLPLVVYLGVFRPVPESIFLTLVFGITMDSLSGSPFGLYVITYAWMLIGVRGSMRFLDAGSYFLFPLILALGIVFENLLFAFSVSAGPSVKILVNALWALATAPLFLLFFNGLFGQFRRIVGRLGSDRQGK